jgi:Flp pilus assembly protein CpaB
MQNTMSRTPRMADRRVLIVALVLGAVAAGLAVAFLSSQSRPPIDETVVTLPVLVAVNDIPVGTKITDEMIAERSLPSTAVATDVLRNTERARAIGQTVRYPIAKGEQIGSTRLVGTPLVSAISFQIPPGTRGFTFSVGGESPVALLAPGDFVDVLLKGPAKEVIAPALVEQTISISTPFGTLVTRDVNGVQRLVAADQITATTGTFTVPAVPPDTEVVVTLFQNVQVLAIGTAFVENGITYDDTTRGAPPKTGGALTVALDPQQSQLMYLARGTGEMTIVLRRFGENQPAELRPIAGPVAR